MDEVEKVNFGDAGNDENLEAFALACSQQQIEYEKLLLDMANESTQFVKALTSQ